MLGKVTAFYNTKWFYHTPYSFPAIPQNATMNIQPNNISSAPNLDSVQI